MRKTNKLVVYSLVIPTCYKANSLTLKMPSVAEKSTSIKSLTSHFPVTLPIPTPTTNSNLLSIKDVQREEDLLRNPSSFRAWWTAIHTTKESFSAQLKAERRANLPDETAKLLGPLATPLARHSLQCLTYLYEAAIAQFPGSFKLWKSYLQMRMSYVLGREVVKKRAGGRKKLPEMKDALEEEKEDLETWEDGLDGVVGWEEWRALVATYERALMWLPKVCSVRNGPSCFANFNVIPATQVVDNVHIPLLSPYVPICHLSHACSSDV